MQFAPALPLGVSSLGELADIEVCNPPAPSELLERLREVAPEGLVFTGLWPLAEGAPGLSKLIESYDVLVAPAADGREWDETRLLSAIETFSQRGDAIVERKGKEIDVKTFVESLDVVAGAAAARLSAVLDWPASRAYLRARVSCTALGSVKPIELARVMQLAGEGVTRPRFARLGFGGVRLEAVSDLLPASAMDALSSFEPSRQQSETLA
jgi:hypothetical protein